MAEIRQYVCDVCGATKGAANHWWRIFIGPFGFGVQQWESQTQIPTLQNLLAQEGPDELHICGRACLGKKLEEWMGAVK